MVYLSSVAAWPAIRSRAGPLSSVAAISTWTPWAASPRAISRTTKLGPPRKGPTEGITCRTFTLLNPRAESYGGAITFAPSQKDIQAPRLRPAHRAGQEALPEFLDLPRGQSHGLGKLPVREHCADFGTECRTHPAVEWEGKAHFAAMPDVFRYAAAHRLHQKRFGNRTAQFPPSREPQDVARQRVMDERHPDLQRIRHAHTVGIAQQQSRHVAFHFQARNRIHLVAVELAARLLRGKRRQERKRADGEIVKQTPRDAIRGAGLAIAGQQVPAFGETRSRQDPPPGASQPLPAALGYARRQPGGAGAAVGRITGE